MGRCESGLVTVVKNTNMFDFIPTSKDLTDSSRLSGNLHFKETDSQNTFFGSLSHVVEQKPSWTG